MLKSYLMRLARPVAPLLALLLGAYGASAQVSGYTLTPSVGTYTALGAASTQVTAVQADDAVSAAIPLGFTFAFDGSTYTQVVASSNGFLSFNTAAGSANANSLTTAAASVRPLVAPLWDNLAGTATGTTASRASYQTTGSSPNQVFTFEWRNWKWDATATGATISFQVKLYQNGNRVEYVYQPGAAALTAPTASIGLAGVGTGSGSFLSLSDATAAPTTSSTTENASIGTKPANGQVYSFAPGAFACTAPQSVTAGSITTTGATISFVGSAGASSYTVTYTPAGGTPTTVTPNPTASPVNLTGLTTGTAYTVSVVSNCAGGATSAAGTTTFTPSAASYCTANLGGGGCAAADVISAVSITGTTLNNTTNNCAVTNGSSYSTFPASGSTTATLTSGSGAYTISVTSSAASAIGMWIDYDQSGTFDTGEYTQVSGGGRPGQAATATFTVPATALQGTTKMRIRTRTIAAGPGGGIAGTNACTNFTTGETEDYTITIGAPAACAAVTAAAAGNVTATTARITFTGSANITSYTVTYTPAGGTPTTVAPAPTASPVNLTGLTAGTAYTVTIVGNCASGSSTAVTVTFTTPAVAPANDNCATAVAVPVTATCTSPTSGTVLGATQSIAATANCGNFPVQNALDVWYSFVATAASHTVTLTPQFAATLDVRSGTCANSTSLSCIQTLPNTAVSRVVTGLTVGSTYFVRVYPIGPAPAGNASAFTLCVIVAPTAPANDNCAAAVTVQVTADCTAPTTGTVAGATQSIAPTNNCGGGMGTANTAADVWYSFTATGTAHVITLNAAFANAIVDVRSGTCATSTSVSCGTYAAGAASSRQITGLTSGTTYFVRVYSLLAAQPTGATAGFTLCITAVPAPPANDDCATAIAVPVTADCTAPTTGTVASATQSLAPTANCGGGMGAATTAADVWYSFVASGTSQVITLGPAFDAAIVDVRSGTCANSTSISCGTYAARAASSRLITGLTSGSTYFLRVYSLQGNQPLGATAGFYLCITAAPAVPANDDCTGAIALTVTADCSSPTVGTIAAATQSLNPTANCGNGVTAAPDVWYSFVATATSHVIAAAAQFAGIVDVRSGSCANSTSIFCNTLPRNSTINNLTVGSTYFIRIYSTAATVPVGIGAAFNICVTTVPVLPANDDPCGAVALTNNTVTNSTNAGATNTSATVAPGLVLPTSCGNVGTPRDVWFTMVAPGTSATISVSGSPASLVRVFSATTCSTGFVEVGCRVVTANTVQPLVFTGLTAGRTYYVAVSGATSNGLTGAFTITANAVLATQAQINNSALQVYPNPSNTGQLTLRLDDTHTAAQATLLNVLGQPVRTQGLPAGTTEHTLAVRGLAAGVYTLRVAVGNAVLTRKVVLE